MSDITRILSNLLAFVNATNRGFGRAGLPEEEFDETLASMLSGRETLELEEVAFKFGLRRLEERSPASLDRKVFDLGDGLLFTCEDIIEEVNIDYTIHPTEVSKDREFSKDKLRHMCQLPSGVYHRKVTLVVGRLSDGWTEASLGEALEKPGSPLEGSGAWAREAYLKLKPSYDDKRPILFPDKATSRWWVASREKVFFPVLWGERDGKWKRGLAWAERKWHPKERLCLIVSQ